MPSLPDARLRALALSLPGAWEDFPFGPGDPTIKAGPKIFAFVGSQSLTVKVDPERGEALRGAMPDLVAFAPYLSKRHWVRIALAGFDPDELDELLAQSYDLVVASLTRAQRQRLSEQPPPPE